jgi:hypothetical protein
VFIFPGQSHIRAVKSEAVIRIDGKGHSGLAGSNGDLVTVAPVARPAPATVYAAAGAGRVADLGDLLLGFG